MAGGVSVELTESDSPVPAAGLSSSSGTVLGFAFESELSCSWGQPVVLLNGDLRMQYIIMNGLTLVLSSAASPTSEAAFGDSFEFKESSLTRIDILVISTDGSGAPSVFWRLSGDCFVTSLLNVEGVGIVFVVVDIADSFWGVAVIG